MSRSSSTICIIILSALIFYNFILAKMDGVSSIKINGLKPTLIIVVNQKNEHLPAGIQGYTHVVNQKNEHLRAGIQGYTHVVNQKNEHLPAGIQGYTHVVNLKNGHLPAGKLGYQKNKLKMLNFTYMVIRP